LAAGAQELARFAIGFDRRDRARLHALWDEVIDSEQWSEGEMTRRFEAAWAAWNGAGAVATGSWTGGALAALEFAGGARGGGAVPLEHLQWPRRSPSWRRAGGPSSSTATATTCCASPADFEAKLRRHRPKPRSSCTSAATWAFEVRAIAELCAAEGVFLIEDCAHAHGAEWHGRRPGTWGDAGVYSFYATKTVSAGEGGNLVSGRDDVLEFARAYRNYGKPDHQVAGLNFRMSEFTAALALVQTERMEEIVAAKNALAREHLDPLHPGRMSVPDGMVSGPLQVHRLRRHRALDRQGLRAALPPHQGHRRRAAQQRLGRRASLVRSALLPAGHQRAHA
jgi:dTDP-4-amino-4,6-dideoxygalactose transaminase